MRNIQVCHSPALFQYYDSVDRIIVVTDILRATSAICTAFQYGVKSIIPVATIEEARQYRQMGYMAAAERNGIVQDGFEFGNSPFSYMTEHVKGQIIALTTTNGTQAVEIAKDASKVIIGSFLNLSAVANWILQQSESVTVLCSGWKNRYNMEDTLFAGALVEMLKGEIEATDYDDAALAAQRMYNDAKNNLYDYLQDSSHRHRMQRLDLEKDVRYCLQTDVTNVVPILQGKHIVNAL
jgi:2-phosphosulfolactate phosphatase